MFSDEGYAEDSNSLRSGQGTLRGDWSGYRKGSSPTGAEIDALVRAVGVLLLEPRDSRGDRMAAECAQLRIGDSAPAQIGALSRHNQSAVVPVVFGSNA